IFDKTDIDLILDRAGVEEDKVEVGVIPPNQRANHIINLLELSAPNLSLKTHRDEYFDMYNKAVYPEGGKINE
ncbi:hypothetical protein LBX66_004671, partial [Salmonella enterica]|nr:hypothetical protein [Salmonella enterica]